MITTVTLNPCIDRTITVNGFNYGGLNRCLRAREDVSGKGINISMALSQLGYKSNAIGFVYRDGYEKVISNSERFGFNSELIMVEGALRVNIKVFNEQEGVMTEFNESGSPVTAKHVDEVIKKIVEIANKSNILVLTGSVPQGTPKDIYHTIMKAVNPEVKVILDAEGELFLNGLKAKPYLVKPNLFELEDALKTKFSSNEEIIKAAREMIQEGVQIVTVSMGKDGALIVDKDNAFLTKGSPIDVKGVQGAGDSMIAGMCIAISENLSLESMLKYAVSAAQASLIREGTQLCTREDFLEMLDKVHVERIDERR